MKEAKNFSQQLNILRAGVLGANDGIISVAGVVIGVASATHNLWIIFISSFRDFSWCIFYGWWGVC